jgi:hypothetical protein
MIEIHRTPLFIGMTGCTSGLGVILRCDIGFVYILMTVFAIDPDSAEIPGSLFFMTFKAGNSEMGSLEREDTLVMLLNSV